MYDEDEEYQTHYVCNECGYEFWSDNIEVSCPVCGSNGITEE